MDDSALSIENLVKRYKSGTVAVDNISLEIKKGDFFGFLGPNGAGKSTAINCITGIAKITSGTIKVFGIDVVEEYREARKKVGLSPQEFNVDFFGQVEKVLDHVGGYYGMPKKRREERIEELGFLQDAPSEGKQNSSSSPATKPHATSDEVGGINLNPALMDLQIKRDGNGVPLPFNLQPDTIMNIEGLIPVIINVTPVVNLPMLLGWDIPDADNRPFDSADSDKQPSTMDLGFVDKYRNKFVREYYNEKMDT